MSASTLPPIIGERPLIFTVSKAEPIGLEHIAGAVLSITGDLPRVPETLPPAQWRAAAKGRHVEDAQQVVAALAALPQGTIDQVLILLLQQRASLLQVPGPTLANLPSQPPAFFKPAVAAILDFCEQEPTQDKRVTLQAAVAALWAICQTGRAVALEDLGS